MLTRCEHPLSLKKLAAPFSLCVLSEEARNHPEYVFLFFNSTFLLENSVKTPTDLQKANDKHSF
jgi:hypothetical protein